MTPIVLILAPLCVATVAVLLYNQIRRAEIALDYALSQLLVQLQRRSDLIPNLFKCVASYSSHERAMQADLAGARYTTKAAFEDLQVRATSESQQLREILAMRERYAGLQADHVFAELERELVHTERLISFSRAYLTERTDAFNTCISTVPRIGLARRMGCRRQAFFAFEDLSLGQENQSAFPSVA